MEVGTQFFLLCLFTKVLLLNHQTQQSIPGIVEAGGDRNGIRIEDISGRSYII